MASLSDVTPKPIPLTWEASNDMPQALVPSLSNDNSDWKHPSKTPKSLATSLTNQKILCSYCTSKYYGESSPHVPLPITHNVCSNCSTSRDPSPTSCSLSHSEGTCDFDSLRHRQLNP